MACMLDNKTLSPSLVLKFKSAIIAALTPSKAKFLVLGGEKQAPLPTLAAPLWDPVEVLNYIAEKLPANSVMDFMQLCCKAVTLVLLATGCRQQNLTPLRVNSKLVCRTSQYLEFAISVPVNNYTVGGGRHTLQRMRFPKYHEDKRICPHYLCHYIDGPRQ